MEDGKYIPAPVQHIGLDSRLIETPPPDMPTYIQSLEGVTSTGYDRKNSSIICIYLKYL